MKKEKQKRMRKAAGFLTAFALWTAAVILVDVQPIGPMGSSVGLASLNGAVYRLTGVRMAVYALTDWLSLVPVFFMLSFACLGLGQWMKRRSFLAVDRSILALGAFYVIVLAAYVLFEVLAVNYRPVLIEGVLEASYPSSTTMLVLCVIPTAMMQMEERIKRVPCKGIMIGIMAVYTVGMVALRLLSGVHWFSDIVGGILLSAGLVSLYSAFSGME